MWDIREPNSVTEIGDSAFKNCTSLNSIIVPSSVTQIGRSAFQDCSSLNTVYCKALTPPMGNLYMFDNNTFDRKIYVPKGCVSEYKSAYGWKDYANDIYEYDFSSEE